jgi:parallel beta-helix repeat protein
MTKHLFPAIFVATIAVVSVTSQVVAAEPKTMVDAAEFILAEDPTCGIQDAIDALPPDGGTLIVPPGTFPLRRSLVLRSHVQVRGSGSTTIFTRGREVASKLTTAARKGETSVEVESTEGFLVGDEVALMDDRMHGWYMAHGIVKEVAKARLVLVEAIRSGHAEGVFSPERNAVAVNYFPFFCANRMHFGKPVSDITIEDLTVDSNMQENPGPWTDFTLAVIHLANVSDSLVRNVTIRGSVGDGIGVQAGHDNRVESCLVERCRVHGFHPGTSLRGAVFSGNIGRHNGGDGLYFCAQVFGITVTENLFHDNGSSGIGGLGPGGTPGDRFNIVANNVCRNNGRWGIAAYGGKNNVITSNICINNSQEEPGRYSGISIADSTHMVVTGNRCGFDGDKPTQKLGIEERGTSNKNVITGNLCEGNIDGGISIVGPDTQALGNVGSIVRPK